MKPDSKKSQVFTVSIPKWMAEEIKRKADEHDMTLSEYFRHIFKQLDKGEKENG